MQNGIPVDETFAAIDQAFLMQLHEYLSYGFRQAFIHSEAITAPIDGGTESSGLFCNLTTGLFFPRPHTFYKFFSTEIAFRYAVIIQQSFYDHLCRDTGMVHARLPESSVTFHAMEACQRIHDGVLEGMTHVQGAGHIRRWDDNTVGRSISLRFEIALLFPTLVDALLDVLWLVGLVH